MTRKTTAWATLSLAATLIFSSAACSRPAQSKGPSPGPAAQTESLARTGMAEQSLLPPAAEEAPAPEQTAPPIDFSPAADYVTSLTAALQKAGYTGRESVDIKAELARQAAEAQKAEAAGEDAPSYPSDPAATAKSAFGELAQLHDVFVWTKTPRNIEYQDDKAWQQQIIVLGNISITQPAEKDGDGRTVTPETRYGKMLFVTVGASDAAEKPGTFFITITEGWGSTDGRTLTQDGLDGLSARQYRSLTGVDSGAENTHTEFTWSERQQARGAIADWLRDNTTPAKAAPAPVKAAAP